MIDEQNKPVRTRDEQIEALASQFGEEGTFSYVDDRDAATQHIAEAEARGAAEQRRKDAERQEPVAWAIPGQLPSEAFPHCELVLYRRKASHNTLPLYTHPANVAALEDRVGKLEGERDRLRDALIACGNNAGGFLAPGVSTEFLIECVPEEVRLKISSLTREGGV
ncbi:hypothetical protein [Gluconobacter sp. P1C6_b]|uniref:hypothetical protein n=1 Tax=Gluconobacter sp. P1C6_b TaxID=2762619 RepID=UPI001C052824|nr:hypothetical protein [Gluconobacter sp. P1C6_b]